MATNLSLDPDPIERVLEVSGERTKKAAVTRALEAFILRRKQKGLLDLMGKLEWDESFDYKAGAPVREFIRRYQRLVAGVLARCGIRCGAGACLARGARGRRQDSHHGRHCAGIAATILRATRTQGHHRPFWRLAAVDAGSSGAPGSHWRRRIAQQMPALGRATWHHRRLACPALHPPHFNAVDDR